MENLPTQESTDSTDQPRDFSGERGEFSPLRTGLPPMDELLLRHRVSRGGLVHLDCAPGANSSLLLPCICSSAVKRGENVVLIGVPTEESTDATSSTGAKTPVDQAQEGNCSSQANPNEESDSESEVESWYSEHIFAPGASMRSLGATTLRDVGTLFHILLHEPVLPDLIAIEGFERLFLPDTGCSPNKGDRAAQFLAQLKSSSTAGGEADPIQVSLATLRRWLEVFGGLCRDRGIALWLLPYSPPSLPPSSPNAVFYRELRPLLYAHCDHSLRWDAAVVARGAMTTDGRTLTRHRNGSPTPKVRAKNTIARPNLSPSLALPVSLYNFSTLRETIHIPVPPLPN